MYSAIYVGMTFFCVVGQRVGLTLRHSTVATNFNIGSCHCFGEGGLPRPVKSDE